MSCPPVFHPENDCICNQWNSTVYGVFQIMKESILTQNSSVAECNEAYNSAVKCVEQQYPYLAELYSKLSYEEKAFGCDHYHRDEFKNLSAEDASLAMALIHNQFLEAEQARQLSAINEELLKKEQQSAPSLREQFLEQERQMALTEKSPSVVTTWRVSLPSSQ